MPKLDVTLDDATIALLNELAEEYCRGDTELALRAALEALAARAARTERGSTEAPPPAGNRELHRRAGRDAPRGGAHGRRITLLS
jgi:hypothetical protein